MSFLLALTPILLILFLMLVLRWGTARAGSAGYLSALVISILFFGAERACWHLLICAPCCWRWMCC